MNIPKTKTAALALAVGLALAGIAVAQDAPTPAQQKELDAARADLDKAAQRFAELHRKYGGADAPLRIEKRMLRKPVIGVLLTPDDASGVRIAGVTPDSAAAAGGLKSGDRIVSIDGKALKAADGAARVEEARELLGAADTKTPVKLGFERDGKTQIVSLTPKVGDRLLVVPDGAMFDGNVQVFAGENDEIEVMSDRMHVDTRQAKDLARIAEAHARVARIDAKRQAEWAAAVAPDLRRDIVRLRSDCKGDDCKLPALAEAFRWNGLNLASVEGGLGRYFGTDKGVLVLSTGKDLEGLQAGDVIQKIAGKPVNSPREAMDALRAQPAEGKVAVEYLRDRATSSAQVSVPKALAFTLPRAPVAPQAPMAPRPPAVPGIVEHRKMASAGEDGKKVEKRKYVVIDKDGKRKEWEGNANDTPPAWVQSLPKDGRRVEKRVQVIVDDNGNKTVIEDDDLPPPPPPAAPSPPPPPMGD